MMKSMVNSVSGIVGVSVVSGIVGVSVSGIGVSVSMVGVSCMTVMSITGKLMKKKSFFQFVVYSIEVTRVVAEKKK